MDVQFQYPYLLLIPSVCFSDFVVVRIPQSERRRGAALHTVSPVSDGTASSLQPHFCPDQLLFSSGLQHISVLWGKQLQPLALIWVDRWRGKTVVRWGHVRGDSLGSAKWNEKNKGKKRRLSVTIMLLPELIQTLYNWLKSLNCS